MPKGSNLAWMVLVSTAVVFAVQHYQKTHS